MKTLNYNRTNAEEGMMRMCTVATLYIISRALMGAEHSLKRKKT